MKTAPCRGCGRPITFIKSAAGQKWIPVDPSVVSAEDIAIRADILAGKRVSVVTDDGYVMPITENSTISGRVPHWSTCPKADEFRRR